MTTVVFVVFFGLGLWWMLRRRRRARELAGRVADRPTYMTEPPRRHVGLRRTELL